MALSPSFTEALHAQESGEVAIVLMRITHPATAEVGRVSSDPTQRLSEDPLRYGTISRGEAYTYIPMEPIPPDSQESTPPQARILLDNIDRELVALIRGHQEPATVTMEIVSASDPDAVETLYPPMEARMAEYDARQIILDLRYKPLDEEAFPLGQFHPAAFPGLF